MKTCAEHLPIELWISIFNYLEINDLFYTFTNLNHHFDRILASKHLSFYVRPKDTNKSTNLLSTPQSGLDTILNRIIYIEDITADDNVYIPQFLNTNLNKLIRLRSLNIKISLCDEHPILIRLQELNLLEYLSLECVMTQVVIENILALTSLRICKLIYRNMVTPINYSSNKQSNIEIFSLQEYHDDHSIINIFLRHMPKLKRMDVLGSTLTINNLGLSLKDNYDHLQKLHTVKIKCSTGDHTMMFFQQLRSITSVLKHFSVDLGPTRWNECLLESLICYSWPILEQIEKIHIYIRGYICFDPTKDYVRKKYDNYCKILLAKNNQSNGCLKIQWTEEYLASSTVIHITVLKS